MTYKIEVFDTEREEMVVVYETENAVRVTSDWLGEPAVIFQTESPEWNG